MQNIVSVADYCNFDSGHREVGFERFVDVLKLEVVGHQLFDRQTNAFGAFQEIEGDGIILRAVDP